MSCTTGFEFLGFVQTRCSPSWWHDWYAIVILLVGLGVVALGIWRDSNGNGR